MSSMSSASSVLLPGLRRGVAAAVAAACACAGAAVVPGDPASTAGSQAASVAGAPASLGPSPSGGPGGPAPAWQPPAADGPVAAPDVLRVCADPNNLPFSNAREEGFENRIA